MRVPYGVLHLADEIYLSDKRFYNASVSPHTTVSNTGADGRGRETDQGWSVEFSARFCDHHLVPGFGWA